MTAIPAHPSTGRRLRSSLQLLQALSARDLNLRYQGSIFGWGWTLVRPLALAIVLSFALGKVLAAGTEDYGLFLIAGLFPWFWFQGAVQAAAGTFVGNAGLLKKVRFPRAVLPASVVMGNTLQFLLTLPVLVLFVFIYGRDPSWVWIPGIPLLMVLQLLLTLGLALFVSTVTVFFRDLEHIVEVSLTLLFYTTPILFRVDQIPDGWEWVTKVNPLAPIIEGWRSVMLDGEMPGTDLWISAALTVVFLVVGWFTFSRFEDEFADAV